MVCAAPGLGRTGHLCERRAGTSWSVPRTAGPTTRSSSPNRATASAWNMFRARLGTTPSATPSSASSLSSRRMARSCLTRLTWWTASALRPPRSRCSCATRGRAASTAVVQEEHMDSQHLPLEGWLALAYVRPRPAYLDAEGLAPPGAARTCASAGPARPRPRLPGRPTRILLRRRRLPPRPPRGRPARAVNRPLAREGLPAPPPGALCVCG